MRDARGQHAGLAGAGAGQHQNRTIERLHRLALLGIEPVEIARATGCRRTRARGNPARGRLVIGGAGVRQFVRLVIANRAYPTMAPWGRERELS